MNIFKKTASLFAMLGIVFLLASCTESPDPAEMPTPTPTPTPTEDVENPDDAEGEDYSNFTMDYSAGIAENGYWENLTPYDHIKPFEYIGIEIPFEVHNITDEALQSELDMTLDSYATTEQVTDRAVKDGDTVNIDYVGSVDGVEFAGGSTGGTGAEVTIGITSYIDDFLEQLIGHTPGETFDVNVTFPDEYSSNPDLEGKDAVFVTTINYISETVRPELTDEFVTTNFSDYGWKNVEEMRAGVADILSQGEVRAYIQNHLLESVEVISIPEDLYNYQRDTMISSISSYATAYGVDFNTYLLMMGYSELEEFFTIYSGEIDRIVTYLTALQAIALEQKIEVTEIDLENYFFEQSGNTDYSEYEAFYGKPFVVQLVLQDTIGTYLMDNAVLLEA